MNINSLQLDLQAQFDQELADEQPQLQTAESSFPFLSHAPPDLAAGPLVSL